MARPGKVQRNQATTCPVTCATVLCGRPNWALTVGVVNNTLRKGSATAYGVQGTVTTRANTSQRSPLLLTCTCRLEARLSRQLPRLRICGPQRRSNVSSTAIVTWPLGRQVATSSTKSRRLTCKPDQRARFRT